MNLAVVIGAGLKVPLQRETEAWIARGPANMRRDYWTYVLAVNEVITRGKRDGWYGLLDTLYFTCAPTEAIAQMNIVSTNFPLSSIGGATFIPYTGYLFNGTSSYLDPKVDLSKTGFKYQQDSATLFGWVLNDAPGAWFFVGATSTGARASLRARNGLSGSFNSNTLTVDGLKLITGEGFMAEARLSSAGYTGFKSGVSKYFATPSSGVPSGPLYFGRLGAGATYSKDLLAIGGLGAGFTPTQLSSAYAAFLQFLIRINAIDDDDPPQQQVYGSCIFPQSFIASYVQPPSLEIVQQLPPPPDMTYDNTQFVGFPATRYSTQQIDQLVACTRTDIKGEHFLWGCREVATRGLTAFPNVRPNLIGPAIQNAGIECRLNYTTRKKARAAWIVAQRYSAGALPRNDARYPDGFGWLDFADAAGFNTAGWSGASNDTLTKNLAVDTGAGATSNVVMHHEQLKRNPGTYFTQQVAAYNVAIDVIYLPVARAADSTTVVVDSFLRDTEDQTNLTPAELLSTMQEAAASCHATGHRFVCYNNPPNGGGAAATGFSKSNAYQIAQAVDLVSIVAWPQNAEKNMLKSLENQKAIFLGPNGDQPFPSSKIQLTVGIGALGQELSDADCLTIYNWRIANGITSLIFWRDYATLGGAATLQVNRVIAIVLTGNPPPAS